MTEPTEAQALLEATREVLETMFFTDVAPDSETDAATATGLVAALRFEGERPGEFRVTVTPAAARTIAANFLGTEDDEVPESRIEEVTCELANMICGSVLSRVEADLAFDLSHPELVPAEAAAPWTDASARSFNLDNGSLTAAIRFARG